MEVIRSTTRKMTRMVIKCIYTNSGEAVHISRVEYFVLRCEDALYVDVAYYQAVNTSYIHIQAAAYCFVELWKRSGPSPSKPCSVPDQGCDVKHDLQVKSQRLNHQANDSGFIIPNSRHNRPPFHRSFSRRKQKENARGMLTMLLNEHLGANRFTLLKDKTQATDIKVAPTCPFRRLQEV